jgi:non-canonical (house-cleaning) NTP pyrophosphatase
MKIALGSTRSPKVQALEEAWQIFSSNILDDPDEKILFSSFDVTSSSPAMPLSVDDLMSGAYNRVESLILQLKKEKAEAEFYVGLEGGFNIVDYPGARRQVFLESWAYVSDGHDGFFGHGGGIYVPPQVSNPVVDRRIELGIVIDRFSEQTNVRSKQGAWGILTRDILDRKHSFVIALIAAFAPFYNRDAYR